MTANLLWTFPSRRMSARTSLFAPEWVAPRAEIAPPLAVLRGAYVWLAAERGGGVFLRGHIRVAKIAQCVDDIQDDSILLVADHAASFCVSRTCSPRWKLKMQKPPLGISEINGDTVKEITALIAANSKFALAKRRVQIAVPANIWAGGSPAIIAAETYAHALRSVALDGAFKLASDKVLTPFGAAVLSSIPENFGLSESVERTVRTLDAEVDQILCADISSTPRQSGKPHKQKGDFPMVDTVLLPLDPMRITARVFLKSDADFKRNVPEKTSSAEARHQEILRQSAKRLANLGFSPLWSESVDLAVRAGGRLCLFEIKSATKDNFQNQIRRGLIQALEYQVAFEKYGHTDVCAAVVIDSMGTALEKRYFKEFGSRIGITVFYHEDQKPLPKVESFLRP